jgi:alpha-D-xyloside xylohydrolase
MMKELAMSRRGMLMAGAAAAGVFSGFAARAASGQPDFIMPLETGTLQVAAVSDRAFRVRVTAGPAVAVPPSPILLPQAATPGPRTLARAGVTRLVLPHIACEIDGGGRLRFFDAAGRLLLSEAAGGRKLTSSKLGTEQVWVAEQGFDSPAGERLYGTGCFQDGALDVRGLPRRLTQVNTQISLPFMLSSRGYGLLWHNTGMSDFNPPAQAIGLQKSTVDDKAEVANVTTTGGNAQVARRGANFEGRFDLPVPGKYAFQLDIGRKMASRHTVEIDGKPFVDISNLWLPPTTSFIADLTAGPHTVRVVARDEDAPVLRYGQVLEQTVWRSPVAEAIDYVVIAGPEADAVMAGHRQLLGAAPLMPKWGYGYLHCRERFTSSDEILETAREFRRRRLPVDMMVQDWQYWGKYGWNAMRFDETSYPDPKALTDGLHAMNLRLMLSVWSKIGRDTELGKAAAAKGYYIPDTEWIDFYSPAAAAFYWRNMNERLVPLGIDAWWQDATEPENDDLAGRMTAAGPGDRVRLTYPLQVTRTVFEGLRQSQPAKRVMILTRSAFPGQQRYAAATWSGDIGNDWDTLKRQIPAGLNMAAAGYPYWTVDAGGFFRPGDSQYTDPAYHERFLRWFQYATFLPLQRVHGYQTKTEFWRYGDTVETISRQYLELRYRLLPYIYSTAAEVTRSGGALMRPLVFDFAGDPKALGEPHSYMFGRALHVAPVFEAGVTTWPVYLPVSPGGWYDFWTGEHRAGGEIHPVDAPLSRIPLHVRAGSVLPLGPVVQSTAEASNAALEVRVYPGRDGAFTLHDDNGLDYAYEKGGRTLTRMTWNDRRRELVIARRQGRFDGMPSDPRFTVAAADGRPVSLRKP